MRFISIAGAGLLMSASVALASEMPIEEVKKLIVGVDVEWKSKDGKYRGRARMDADGKAFLTGTNIPGVKADSGTWRESGNKLCFKYKKLRKGRDTCLTYTKLPDGNIMSSSNTIYLLSK